MKFTKMQGLGNDYLYIYADSLPDDAAALSVKLSDRHFGIGSDGMIWILPSDKADFMMRIFNADGSEAKMCGNGIRCVGKYVFDKGYTDKTRITVETLSGIKEITLITDGSKALGATVNMGKAEVSPPKTVKTEFGETVCIPVNVGNPHAVIFTDDAENAPVAKSGSEIASSTEFKGGVNVEFVQKIDEGNLRMRVWERGSGITLACGTGACAAAAAAVHNGLCKCNEKITVLLDGGQLTVTILKNGTAIMTGPAETVFEGVV